MSAPASIPDTTFGLTQSELLILRHQQQLIAQQPGQRGAMPDRGRGTSRHSQPSSRAASAASSQSVPGRIVLDPRNLQSLHASLDNLVASIQGRIHQLEDATQQSANASNARAALTIRSADEEIQRFKAIIKEIDRLEEEILRVKHVREVVRQLRARAEAASNKLDKLNAQKRNPPSGRSDPRRHR